MNYESSQTVQISYSIRRALKAEIKRTGVTPLKLFRDDPGLPEGMTASMVNRWIGGLIKQVRSDHLAYVTTKYAALPDEATSHPDHWIKYTKERSDFLRAEFTRTGHTPDTLFKGVENPPPGLTPAMVLAWCYRKARSIKTVHWNFVLELLASFPDTQAGLHANRKSRRIPKNFSHYRPITDDELTTLRSHRLRTGVGSDKLLKGATDKPVDLQPSMISGWLTGKTKSADPAHINYVLARYASLPPLKPE